MFLVIGLINQPKRMPWLKEGLEFCFLRGIITCGKPATDLLLVYSTVPFTLILLNFTGHLSGNKYQDINLGQ